MVWRRSFIYASFEMMLRWGIIIKLSELFFIVNWISNYIFVAKLRLALFNLINIVPRWIIFCLDLLVCIFSLCFAYFLKYNFNASEIDINELSRNILVFTILNSLVFFSIKTYAGIIRYTSAQDSFRILFSIIISN